eukprot:gene12342-14287_t
MDVPSLVLQLAPAASIIDFIHQIPNWPSLSAQEELCKMLTMEHLVRYPPPAKGYKYLFKCIEKDIISLHNSEDSVLGSDDLFSETFMEMMVEAQTSVVDADNSGYLSFKSVLLPGVYVPIKVIQSHNQVGTKVWGAGVFLGELLQYKTNLLAGQIVLELGAGVGITGLLLGRAIPAKEQPEKVIMTDFHHEVVDLLAHNVDINASAEDPCILEADLLDWSTVTSSDYLRYNARIMIVADCTYSESGNVNLVSAFKTFLHTMTIVEMLCSEKLLGPLGGHATMQHMLATPGVQAGLMVKVNYPWNHTNVADNCVLLVYYTKGFSQPGPYPPACVKVLGRALTNGEKILVQEELGVDESNIQGNGINGCDKCWYANPNDDEVYTFTIPPSVVLKGAQDLDYVTIDGAEVKLDTLEHGLVIDCKNLMDCIVMDFYVQTTEKAELGGYFQKPPK